MAAEWRMRTRDPSVGRPTQQIQDSETGMEGVCRVWGRACQPSRSAEATPYLVPLFMASPLETPLGSAHPTFLSTCLPGSTASPHQMRPTLYSHVRNKPVKPQLKKLIWC